MAKKPKGGSAEPVADWRDSARDLAKKKAAGGRFKLKEGDNALRVLPALKEGEAPFKEFRIHPNVGPKKQMINCGKNFKGEGACWLCDVQIPKLQKGNAAAQKLAEAIQVKEQLVLNVATVNEEGKFAGPHIWYISAGGAKSLAVSVLNMLGSRRRRYDDPKKGYNFVITRTGTGLDTRYTNPEPDEEQSEVPADILKACKPLQVKLSSEAELKAAYFGKDVSVYTKDADDEDPETEDPDDEEDEDEVLAEGDDDDEEEETPKKGKKTKPAKEVSKKKVAVVEEDDDDEEEDEDEEEEDEEEEDEEPAPPPKKSKKKPAAPPPDEDDDEEEDEEEEDDEDAEDEDEDEDDGDEDDEEEDDDDEPPPPPKKSKKPAPAPAKKKKK